MLSVWRKGSYCTRVYKTDLPTLPIPKRVRLNDLQIAQAKELTEMGWTQGQIADKFFVDRGTISKALKRNTNS